MRYTLQVVRYILLLTLVLVSRLPQVRAADDMYASVVQVGVQRAGGRFAIGSAVVISPGILVTACHGTRDAVSITVMRGVEQFPANVQSEYMQHDLCILSAPSIRGPVALFDSQRSLSVGDEVIAVGFSGGFRLRTSVGQVKAMYKYDGARVIRVSASFTRGASGGGLFNRAGHLVGILSFKSTAGDDHNYAMPVDWLSDTNLQRPVSGIEPVRPFWEQAEDLQPFFLRGAWLEGTKDWTGLANFAEQWTLAEPSDAEAWISLARANEKLGRWREAREALRRAASLDPQHAEVQLLQISDKSRLIDANRVHHTDSGVVSTQTARDESPN